MRVFLSAFRLAAAAAVVLGSASSAQAETAAFENGSSDPNQEAASPLVSHYTLFHRSLSTAAGNTASSWAPRAHITLTVRSTALEPYLPPLATYEDLLAAAGGEGSVQSGPLGKAEHAQPWSDWYQLALVPGEGSQAQAHVRKDEGLLTSAKKCHLVSTSPTLEDDLVLHLASSGSPIAISYSVPGLVLNSDACPLPQSGPYAKRWTVIEGVNTTVSVQVPSVAPEPPLRAPIPVKEDGTPEVPPPEKSFLQKYWMYLLPILIIMFIPAEAEHSGSAEHDSSSNRPAPRELAAQRIK
ncbi:hypothetical protein OC845_002117 [Tilletia horrida]|nr:hypothetical protein OC845_002117 [Tilletia horrida]